MKPIKLLLIISALIISTNLKSQNFFIDSSVYHNYIASYNFPIETFSGGYSHTELLRLDSINNTGEFYKVKILDRGSKKDSVCFLRVKDNIVYYSDLYEVSGFLDSFVKINDLIIYDFNLKTGDTLKIIKEDIGLNLHFIIDSIKSVKYYDGIERETQFYHSHDKFNQINLSFAAKGLCSHNGLIPFNYFKVNGLNSYNISICKNNNLLHLSPSHRFNWWENVDFCDRDTLFDIFNSLNKINSNSFSLYPNPNQGSFEIKWNKPFTGKMLLMDQTGKVVFEQLNYNQENLKVELGNLNKGIYIISLLNEDFFWYQKMVIE